MTYIIPIIIAIVTGIPGIYALWVQSKKDKIDIGSSLIKDALSLKDEMKEDKAELKTQFDTVMLMFKDLEKQKDSTDKQLISINAMFLKAEHEIALLKKSVKLLKKRVSYLREGVDTLIQQIKELGGIPSWKPDDLDETEE